MQEHSRFPYSAIVDRPRWVLPNDARLAVWVVPNIEHFLFDRPAVGITQTPVIPDILNYSWRDYGVRVGVWRMMEVLAKHGIPCTAALNSDVCKRYERIVEAGTEQGWEWMGHGRTNSITMAGLSVDTERELIRDVVDTIQSCTGQKVRGWLSPSLTETHNTPDLLAEAGLDYVANWVNDDQPYALQVNAGSLTAIPYSIEINDIPALVAQKMSAENFYRAVCDQFDVLYEEGATTGRVMAIALHPFLMGVPHRSKYLDKALAHIRQHDRVWFAKGSEIVHAWRAQQLTT